MKVLVFLPTSFLPVPFLIRAWPGSLLFVFLLFKFLLPISFLPAPPPISPCQVICFLFNILLPISFLPAPPLIRAPPGHPRSRNPKSSTPKHFPHWRSAQLISVTVLKVLKCNIEKCYTTVNIGKCYTTLTLGNVTLV